MAAPAEHGSRVSARWRIVGWIVLTTALSLLAMMVTLRSVLTTQVVSQADHGIVQEADEFSTFAAEGVDPTTAAPFTSATAMMERYLARQTPATGEAFIAVTPDTVLFSDNAAGDAGELLAADQERLRRILDHPQDSGVLATPQGELRWGRTSAQVDGQTGTLIIGIFTQTAREQVDRDTLLLFWVAAGGLLLTAGIAWLAAGQILRPIRQIRQVADTVDALDLSARVPVEGRDDLAQLATTFNEMLDRVERAHSSQQHFVREVQHHLTEPRARVERQLQRLADPALSDDERANAARRAHRQLDFIADTLARLDLLSQAGQPGFLRPRPVDVDTLLAELRHGAESRIPDRAWTLADTRAGTAVIDPDRAGDAINQLLRNAYEHTAGGATVRLGGERLTEGAEPMVRLWVANDGPPLSQDEARDLFERYRATPDETDEYGMGLGLAVVRAVADAHGGTAWVESGNGNGNRFGIDLPARGPATAEDAEEHTDRLVSALGQEQ